MAGTVLSNIGGILLLRHSELRVIHCFILTIHAIVGLLDGAIFYGNLFTVELLKGNHSVGSYRFSSLMHKNLTLFIVEEDAASWLNEILFA